MMAALEEILHELKETVLEPWLMRLKGRIMLGAVTALVVTMFALMGLGCLLLLVFLALSQHYDPQTAAFVLFCFCLAVCVITLIVHAAARNLETREYEAKFSSPLRRPRRLRDHRPREASRGPSFTEHARAYFAENKLAALAAVVLAGALVGANPRLAFRGATFFFRRRRRDRERDRD